MYHVANAGYIGLHMVSGPLVGFALGYGLDLWLDIHPFGKIIFLILGILGGFLNVYRDTQILLKRMSKKESHDKPKDGA
ncbi:MAG: AtpZ/AtpI family protein [Desulfovibrionaceae bacterium]|nr:AtpZ/AtpI family protein [Desulfovibrionaceae bacterium]